MATKPQRLIVGISGASGSIYGIRLLKALKPLDVESHLILSRAAEETMAYETDLTPDEVRALADVSYDPEDMAAAPASGSFRTLGMVVAPCSMKSLAEIAHGIASTLLTRSADVTLKERRRLVLVARETPLHLGHIDAMRKVTEMGAVVAPPVPAFYTKPTSLEEMVDQSVGRVLDLFGLEADGVRRWREEGEGKGRGKGEGKGKGKGK